MRRWIIEKLGGYPDIDTALEELTTSERISVMFHDIDTLSLEEKNRILTKAVKKFFNTIGPDDILKTHIERDGKLYQTPWMWEGKPLRPEQMELLKAEAKQWQDSFLWKVLQRELKYQGNRKMYLESKEMIDMVAGKLLVYYIDIIETRIKRMVQ